jgi:hypothetical protein
MPRQLTVIDHVSALTNSVNAAAAYFDSLDENLRAGEQTVRQVVAHIVFWHREYVAVMGAIARGRQPILCAGKFYQLNQLAYREFQNVPLPILTKRLIRLQSDLGSVAVNVPNRHKFAFKAGSKPQPITYWLPRIQAHIDGHVARLRQAEKRNKRRQQ